MSDSSRNTDLAKIHIAKKDLDMDEKMYRDVLWTVGRVRSAAKLDYAGRQKVLHYFKQIGWKPKRMSPKGGRPFPALADKAVALWIDMHKCGIINDGSESALDKYVERLTGLSSVRFLNNERRKAYTVIESLKQWRKRYEQTVTE